ncbi:hypothetical protein G5I_02597 [Acromyrmex echinatior]|uniref:Uncharacterized protein n=1 Tax=Acromyrmex echinatior TaxID=103372 RepID=F4WAQ8_ACREC|nr:hypothetical protein G5I_02597 [Acromyrmex echinatior]
MKRGDFLPILPMLGALESLIGGAASVARAVSDRKAARHQTEGHGLYLAPYKRGYMRKRKTRKDILAIQQLYGIKNPKLITTTQPPTSTTTEITTNKPEYVDLYTLQYVDTVLVLHHRIFVTYQRYV